jgi:hypothetical protein
MDLMPVDLVLVRHAESEGCLAHERSKVSSHLPFSRHKAHSLQHGDDSDWQNPGFRNRHTSRYRLSDKGRRQAQIAGQWVRTLLRAIVMMASRADVDPQIKENVSKKFDWYLCSEYVRAMETAALLDLDNAHWHTGTTHVCGPHRIGLWLTDSARFLLARAGPGHLGQSLP